MMNVNIYDTHVRTRDGRHLHFDVLIEGDDQGRAARHAREWMSKHGLEEGDIEQSRCLFCHSEPAHPDVVAALSEHGYFIIPLQGF